MAQLALSGQKSIDSSAFELKQKTYWGSVWRKLYKDKLAMFGLVLIVFVLVSALLAPYLADNVIGFDFKKTNLRERNDPPTWAAESWPIFQDFARSCSDGCEWSLWGEMISKSFTGFGACFGAGLGECHWMGTDDAGRDVFVRGLFGGRISIMFGVLVAITTISLGIVIGLISGYYAATLIDDAINAIIMTLSSIPDLFFLIIVVPIFRPGPVGLALIVAFLGGWTGLSRLIRGQTFSIRERDYVVASRSIGTSPWSIMVKHVLPNVSSIIIVAAVFSISGAIIAEAGLSYLGVGIGPPNASWGNMLREALGSYSKAPWLVIAPGFFLFVTNLGILLLGDGLRDALDPWVKN